ncbi:MAG TPA: response regulator, partial [Polyangiaceae bacterium]|nr:response regulator [Polyangiaceae bacterium]
KHVQSLYPKVVRIVLSGHTELEAALRSISVAHQFLSKPCDAATLQTVVERACDLQAILQNDTVRAAVGSIARLPSVPRVYFEVSRALENPEIDLKAIAALVEQDMAVCAKLLQVVNSSFFGLRKRVASVQQALAYLGVNTVKRLLLSVETFGAVDGAFPSSSPVSIELLQQHAFGVATIASQMFHEKDKAEDAFMAGMLHDVGVLVLASQSPEHLVNALSVANAENRPVHLVEKATVGYDHADVGAYLLGLWGLPFPIIEAVAHHHAPSRIAHSQFEIVDAVHVAETLCDEAASAKGRFYPKLELELAHLETIGVAARLPSWRETVSKTLASMENR